MDQNNSLECHMFDDLVLVMEPDDPIYCRIVASGCKKEDVKFSHISGNKVYFDCRDRILSTSKSALTSILNFDIIVQ